MFVCCTWKPGKRGVMVELWTKIDADFSFVSNVVHTPHTNIVSSHFGPLRVRSEVSIRPTATTYRECRTKPLSPIIDTSGSAPFNFRWLRIGHCFCSMLHRTMLLFRFRKQRNTKIRFSNHIELSCYQTLCRPFDFVRKFTGIKSMRSESNCSTSLIRMKGRIPSAK